MASDNDSDVEIPDEREPGAAGSADAEDNEAFDPRLPFEPQRVFSGILGLSGFITAAVVGLGAGNPGALILTRALLAMLACAIVGRILGSAGETCVREFIRVYKRRFPIPSMPEPLSRMYEQQSDRETVRDEMTHPRGKNS